MGEVSGSQRSRRDARWARGRVGDGVRSSAISAAERLKTTPWSWCGASGVLRVVQEAWATVAELPRNTGRREGVGERGGSRRRFHGRVGRRGRERGKGGESARGEREERCRQSRGSAWRSGTTPAAASRQEVAVRVPACGGHAPRSFWQRKEKTREPLVGWAASWATRWAGRPGKLAQVVLSPSLISVLIWFSIIL